MLQLIYAPVVQPNPVLPTVLIRVERRVLAKRLWRGRADDGKEFGFELARPLNPGETVWETPSARYVVDQPPETVLEISLTMTPAAAAGIGWAIGNLHLELCGEAARLLAPDEAAVRQLLGRLNVPFQPTSAVFRPGHFVRGKSVPSHELGSSHQH
jgi:urease accessory protein